MKRFPFTPYPDGIFAVAFSDDLPPTTVKAVTFMGQTLALFRTDNGDVGAIDRHCPHLGADLTYGNVKRDTLQCPFHGICFKTDGTSNAKNRQGALGSYQIKSFEVLEQFGVIFLIHNPLGRILNIHFPTWKMNDWGKPVKRLFKIKSHPQEILENSVDKAHFYHVHHYLKSKEREPFRTFGTEFTIKYEFERKEGLFSTLERNKTILHLDIHAYGLGLSMVEVNLPRYGFRAKQIVFPQPIDEEFIYIRTMTSIKMPKKIPLISKPLTYFLTYLAGKGFLKDFIPDINIWENKKYIEHPNYLLNDGEFDAFREWARQFYRLSPVQLQHPVAS